MRLLQLVVLALLATAVKGDEFPIVIHFTTTVTGGFYSCGTGGGGFQNAALFGNNASSPERSRYSTKTSGANSWCEGDSQQVSGILTGCGKTR
jgi:hypothetical protein